MPRPYASRRLQGNAGGKARQLHSQLSDLQPGDSLRQIEPPQLSRVLHTSAGDATDCELVNERLAELSWASCHAARANLRALIRDFYLD